MFTKKNDNMDQGPTPERVLAICRMVDQGQGSYTIEDLYRLCILDEDASSHDDSIRSSINVAEELGFIEKSDDKRYKLKIDQENISSATAFRKAVSNVAFRDRDSKFFKLTSWFIKYPDKVMGLYKFDDFKATAAKSEEGLKSITEKDVLGWRFWMRWLGFAYQYNSTLIPNMKTRLEDAFELGKIPKDTKLTCRQFVSWMKTNMPETAAACTEENLPIAISNGLRILDKEKKIKLISTMDAVRTSLSHIDGAEFNSFSDIVIKGSEA